MSSLSNRIVAAREKIFARVNGTEGIVVHERPNGMEQFKFLYAHPAANGRSAGAGLSDLFWYWLAPGPQVHQEHLEPGQRYDEVARCTRNVLARLRKPEWDALVARRARAVLAQRRPTARPTRLRDLAMPIWAEVYYELVFAEPCPRPIRDLIVGNAQDVVNALKCTRLRHLRRRNRLTAYLEGRIRSGEVPFELPPTLSTIEQAWYLQGAFFNTAVVQMSEASAHLLLVLAEHRDTQQQLREHPDDAELFDRVSDEVMRLYPLFGIAHRITTAPIDEVEPPLPAGSVLMFEYSAFQHAGLPDGDQFDPDRFDETFRRTHHFIPFGVSANRPCPARGVAPTGLAALTRVLLEQYGLMSSVEHTRSLPSRGPVLLRSPTDTRAHRWGLAALRSYDHAQGLARSILQLVLGTVMVVHARRLALCRNFFRAHPDWAPTPRPDVLV